MRTHQFFMIAVLVCTTTLSFGQDLISGGTNSWILRTPDADDKTQLVIAPKNDNKWDWSRQSNFYNVTGNSNKVSFLTRARLKSASIHGGLWLDKNNKGLVGTHHGKNSIGFYTKGGGWSMILNRDSGQVGIGTFDIPEDYKLAVNGTMIIEEIHLQQYEEWPDYVFNKDYELLSLSDVENHINNKGHLPNIPSAKEIQQNDGFKTGDMIKKLLEKVEELTLYTIQQQKLIEQQQVQMNELQNKK